jgi:hypothetical protein
LDESKIRLSLSSLEEHGFLNETSFLGIMDGLLVSGVLSPCLIVELFQVTSGISEEVLVGVNNFVNFSLVVGSIAGKLVINMTKEILTISNVRGS